MKPAAIGRNGCSSGPKAFVSVQLNGTRDEAALNQATLAIAKKVVQRL